MLLSIGMMIKNEEKHLRECLESLMPLLDNIESELVIIDTGSTDESVNIAKCFTDKVFHHSWNDNFSEMRNKVTSYCTGEWLLVIDGDEVLQNSTAIINFFKSIDRKKYNTALLMVKNLTDEKDLSSFSMISSPRLFRKDKDFHYEGAVHNQPIFKTPIIKLDSSLIHYGYISTDKELMERKFNRTVNLLKKELERDPLNFYYWYQLSVSYFMHNEYERAMDYSEKSYEILKNNGLISSEYIYVYMQAACSYLINKEYNKTIEICLEGIALKGEILDLYFYLAKAQMMTKDYIGAIKNYRKYLNVAENIEKFNSTNVSLNTLGKQEEAYYDLIIALKEIGDYEGAFVYSNKITDEKLIAENLTNTIFLCLKMKRYDNLYEYYNKYIISLSIQVMFETLVESHQKNLSREEKFEIAGALKDIDSLYGALNKVRYSLFNNEKFSFEINSYVESSVNFKDLPDYYGDFLYYFILHNVNICKFLNDVRELDFNRFFVYFDERYDDFGEKIFSYLKEVNFNEDISSYRIKKALERYSILTARLDDEEYFELFNQFIEDGTTYISKIYSKSTILNEDIYELKNEEESFLLYMHKANLVKDSDKKSYIGYMRKALKVYPYMRRGIEYLLNKFNHEINEVDNELEQYKIQVKNTIKSLIENNRLNEAEALIIEYKKIATDDIESYSIYAIILIMETKLEEAEAVLKEGLTKDDRNFDLLYNLGYLYEKKNNIDEALAIYNIARITSYNEDLQKVVENRITELGKIIKKYNVVLYGDYTTCLQFKEKCSDWDVVGICSYNRNMYTISIEKLKNYDCDFVFVVDEVNKKETLNIFKKNLIDINVYFFEDFKVSVIEGLDYKISKLLSRKSINGIIMGLSYAEVGVKEELLYNNFINFALSAQDLYYDFLLLRYIYKFEEVKNTLKYVIINLGYYSFDYDMTKTISKYRIHRYCKYFDEYHNNDDIIGVNINRFFYEKRITFKEYVNMNKKKEITQLKANDINGEYEALRNSTMNYNNTRHEYEDILNKYLLFLKENNIKPIVVVCPTSFYYREYFDKSNKKVTFYNIINKLKRIYDFQVIDYFESNLFDENDFWDYSHLNNKGAEKFTNILNNEIKW